MASLFRCFSENSRYGEVINRVRSVDHDCHKSKLQSGFWKAIH